MITYEVGKWVIRERLTSDELAALYYAIYMSLDHTHDIETRMTLVYLAEKLFNETQDIKLENL
jgi:hypothetical protein